MSLHVNHELLLSNSNSRLCRLNLSKTPQEKMLQKSKHTGSHIVTYGLTDRHAGANGCIFGTFHYDCTSKFKNKNASTG